MECNLQVMKAEMEKQEHEHKESFADLSLKHTKELKDLGKKIIHNQVFY